jgi:hypothetical protein
MIMLPKDHPDAKKYAVEEEEGPAANGEASTVATPSSSEAGTPVSIDSAPSSSRPSGPPLRRPMRKRPRQSLEAMAAAIDAGKKLTTLEKVS